MQLAAQIIGYIALLFYVFSIQLRQRKKILFAQFLATALFSLHYSMIGAYSGAVIDALSGIRSAVFLNKEKRWASGKVWKYIFLLLFLFATIATWKSVWDILPLIASGVYTIVTHFDSERKMRRFIWIGNVAWLIYNIASGSLPGIIAEGIMLISIFVALVRYDIFMHQK